MSGATVHYSPADSLRHSLRAVCGVRHVAAPWTSEPLAVIRAEPPCRTGELLPALWAEGMRRRVDGTVGPLDSFARAAPPDVAARWAARSRR